MLEAEEKTGQDSFPSRKDEKGSAPAEPGRSEGDWRAARAETYAQTQTEQRRERRKQPKQEERQEDEEEEEENGDYPKGCVVFVKNVHPDATRGTVRSLAQSIMGQEGEVGFVSYEKGMASVRLLPFFSHGAKVTPR